MFGRVDITDIKGFKLGNAENTDAATGCTVIVAEKGATAGVDVRGGGPATRETDLLRSENTIDKIHAVVISGGSAYGLEAGSGVMRELENMKIGHRVSNCIVPIVCQASLFDLNVGQPDVRPDRTMGVKAVHNAFCGGEFHHGNYGAGTGASVGKFYGMNRAMKTGLGTFACSDGEIEVGAITAVNAFADVYDGRNHVIAGLLSADGKRIDGTIRPLKNCVAAESSYNMKSKMEPFFNKHKEETASESEPTEAVRVEPAPAETVEPAEPKNVPEVLDAPETAEVIQEPVPEEVPAVNEESEDMGYGITFNTTISCLITNAKLTKAQCNKLASILHDGYARAIKPVHSTMDGDTIFVMTTGEKDVNFDAFAALATDIVQYSVIDGAISAESAYGLPAAREFLRK
ncbi:MAG: P1 family peptidase [Mogibacterium sp.]|uniref:P1 family peptidase n=1 Tax=Mogibacterium sp. TaxID=2049035 RepID=UPI001A3EE3F6|nr:P1 family peptidase [Mogibacterium sp.]MBL6469078.1 P1 family peptidase [Mogibacterium sp.]